MKVHFTTVIFLSFFFGWVGIDQPQLLFACPACQNPNLPVVPNGTVFLDKGAIQWGTTLSTSPIWVRHEAGCVTEANCQEAFIQPKHFHNQFMLPMELRTNLDWGWSETFGISVQIPIRLIYTTINYELPNGQSYEPLDANIHHRNETLGGLGDGIFAIRLSKSFISGWWLITRLGSSIPLGRTENNPFSVQAQKKEHQHIQMGTGTFDPFMSLALARRFSNWQSSLYGQASIPLYENTKGFQGGVMTFVNAKLSYRLKQRSLLHLGLSWLRQGAEQWEGEVQQDGIYGRQELLLGLGTTFSFGGPQYSLNIQTPLWRELFQGSQTETGELFAPLNLSLGIQGFL